MWEIEELERAMIFINAEQGWFKLRAAAVCVHTDHVLLHQIVGRDDWFMPGGQVEFGESTRTTLAREMREELGTPVTVKDLLWVVENFFQARPRAQEVTFYYRIALPPDSPLSDTAQSFTRPDADGTLLRFQWFRVEQLAPLPLFPTFLRTALGALPATTIHIVHTDPSR
jgi:8-oxo-dGTP pyrophosphatase MutT (NUDIX family)